MTLNEAKMLLDEKSISFSELSFQNVAEFRRHISPFAESKGAAEHPVTFIGVSYLSK